MIASRPVYPVLALRVVLAAAFLCLLASCPQSIPELRGAVSIRLVSPEGRVLSQSASRTILPDFARLVDHIDINRYAPGGTEPLATHPFNNLENTTLADIDPGSWEFEAKLYFTGASEPFATGRSAETTIEEGGTPTVNIPLAYRHGTGTGYCTISVSWPAADADALSWGLDALNDSGTIDQSKMNTVSYTDSTTGSASIAITNAQAGAHRLVLAFLKDNQNAGVFTESVNIFAGVAASDYIQVGGTAATISFGGNRLLDTNASLSRLVLKNGASEIALSPDFTSATHEYTIPMDNLSSFTFTPTRSIAGQKIVYTWNEGNSTNILSGDASTSLAIGASESNTLVITVTAPNGSATQTYTVRFVNSADIGWSLNPEYAYLGISAPGGNTTIRLPHGSGPASITLGATTGFTDYAWATNLGGLAQSQPLATYTFTPSNAGTYSVWCTAKKDGLLYSSNTIVITVLPPATLVYNGNGHTSGTVPSWDGVVTTVAAQGDMVKSGYQFVGWNTNRTATNASVSPGANIPAAVTNNTDNVVLYAIWENVAPPPVTNVVITPLSDSLKVTWQDPDVADLKEVQVILAKTDEGEEEGNVTVHPGVQTAIVPGYDASNAATVSIYVWDGVNDPVSIAIDLPANFGNMSTFHVNDTINASKLKTLLETNPNGLFILQEDITLDNWIPACTDGFYGTFDGNGKTITINASIMTNRGGFIANLANGGVIRNLHINITDTTAIASPTDDHYYGGIAAFNAGLIEFCSVSGTISKYNRVGGIVGVNNGTVRYCYSTTTITGSNFYIGGLAGNNNGTIQDSYARGSVKGSDQTGGLLGRNENTGVITRCYSTGVVTCTGAEKGGLIGLSSNAGVTFTNSFYDSNTSGQNDTGKGTPKTTANMKTQSTFTDWDFSSIWAIDTNINDGYPYLRYFGENTVALSTTAQEFLAAYPSSYPGGTIILNGEVTEEQITTIGSLIYNATGPVHLDLSKTNMTSFPQFTFNDGIGTQTNTTLQSVVLPSTMTSLSEYAFFRCANLSSINLESVTVLGTRCLSMCTSLSQAMLCESLTTIGPGAFAGCSSLESLQIPDGVSSLSSQSIEACRLLKTINIGTGLSTIDRTALSGLESLETITVSNGNTSLKVDNDGNLLSFDGKTFYRYPSANPRTTYTIPEGVTSLGGFAFGGANKLITLTLPASLESIGFYAINRMDELTTLIINGTPSLISIDTGGITYCPKLTSFELPATLTGLGSATFAYSCYALSSITVATGNSIFTSVDGVLFNSNKTELIRYPPAKSNTSYTVPNTVTSIRSYCFRNASNLNILTFPQTSPPSLQGDSFDSTPSFTEIYVPSGSVDTYKTASNWSDYATKIVATP